MIRKGELEEKHYNHDKDYDKHDYSPGVIEAAAVVFEVSRSGDDRSWIVLVVFIIILGVENIVEHVFLHLADLRVAVDPSLRIQIPHDLSQVCLDKSLEGEWPRCRDKYNTSSMSHLAGDQHLPRYMSHREYRSHNKG